MKLFNLKRGFLLKRYKRFLTDVKVNNKIIQMYIANTGPMEGVEKENVNCYFSEIKNPKKMKYKVEFVENNNQLIGVNTQNPNQLMEESLNKLNLNIKKYKREYKIKNSKFDFLINDNILLEVKNVSSTYKSKKIAFFPDTVSERAYKHAKELSELKKDGFIPYLVFIVQREDIDEFTISKEHYPKYYELIKKCYKEKLIKIIAFNIKINIKNNEYFLNKKIKINL